MPAVHLEVEKKFVADESFELPSLTDMVRGAGDQRSVPDVLVPLAEGESVRQRLTATYFDTEAGRPRSRPARHPHGGRHAHARPPGHRLRP